MSCLPRKLALKSCRPRSKARRLDFPDRSEQPVRLGCASLRSGQSGQDNRRDARQQCGRFAHPQAVQMFMSGNALYREEVTGPSEYRRPGHDVVARPITTRKQVFRAEFEHDAQASVSRESLACAACSRKTLNPSEYRRPGHGYAVDTAHFVIECGRFIRERCASKCFTSNTCLRSVLGQTCQLGVTLPHRPTTVAIFSSSGSTIGQVGVVSVALI